MIARMIEINDSFQARQELEKIGCDDTGIHIMSAKAVFKTMKLEQISAKAANLLKQTFLAKGGEVAITRGTADLSVEYTDALLCATLKQYRLALAQLKMQPWGLPAVAEAIEKALVFDESFPCRNYSWPNRTLSIKPGHTLIMGILNVTPDSFSDGGKYNSVEAALQHACELVQGGADVIDIGAESTRPYGGAEEVSAEEEAERLIPVLEKLIAACPVPISVDTYKACVAEEALKRGAHIINDVWGLKHDEAMAAVVAKYNVPVVIMHNQLTASYKRDIMSEICESLSESIHMGLAAGIDFNNLIIDPGIGFGKTPEQNLVVMSRLEELKSLGCPLLLGTSRKRFIGEVLGLTVNDRIEGTGATVAVGITKGVHIVRVHDVKQIARIARMTDAMLRSDRYE